MNEAHVFEMQGLYGSYSIPESVLQYIWFNGDFNHTGLKTQSGKSITILNPGRWNHSEGPDFLEAVLKIEGKITVGSIEVHFQPLDWFHHEHHENPFFDSVILHVVLTQENGAMPSKPKDNRAYFSNSSRELETLSLLPHLNMDLENYAIEQALLSFENKDISDFKYLTQNLSEAERASLLYTEAKARFHRKVKFAKRRLEHNTWDEVCHVMLLEVLGYARNRLTMSNLGLHHPLKDWNQPAEVFYEKYKGDWKLSGIRPANQPITRLRQYTSLVKKEPDWPQKIIKAAASFQGQDFTNTINSHKRSQTMQNLKKSFQCKIFHNFVGETRFHTIMIDAILPLLEAEKLMNTESMWFDWWVGDKPDTSKLYLNQLLSEQNRTPNRNAWIQGLYGLLIKQFSRISEIPNEHFQRDASMVHFHPKSV